VTLFACCDNLRAVLEAPAPDVMREAWARDLDQARTVLERERYLEAWERGRSMALEEAAGYAARVIDDRQTSFVTKGA
jgi:hypothetical protein